MNDLALEVYRAARVLNGAISDAVQAGYEVNVDLETLSIFSGRNIARVRVEVLQPIPPDEAFIAINEHA